jgi:hypothetical protein
MKRIICIIDYTNITKPDYQYRGKILEEIINRFTFQGNEPFKGKFFQYAKDLPWDREDGFVLSTTCLFFLHSSNACNADDERHCNKLTEFCQQYEIPLVLFSGSPSPNELSAALLENRLEKVLENLSGDKNKKSKAEIEKKIFDIVNEKTLKDYVLKYFDTLIIPPLALLRHILEGFLLLHKEKGFEPVLGYNDSISPDAVAHASRYDWFAPLLAEDQDIQNNFNQFKVLEGLFTPKFDKILTELFCLLWRETFGFPDESIEQSLRCAFENNEREMIDAIREISGKKYKGLDDICRSEDSIGKLFYKNAAKYSVHLLLSPESPPLSQLEKKYLDNFSISDGLNVAMFLNLCSEERLLEIPNHVRRLINNSLREFVQKQLYQNKEAIIKGSAIQNIEDFKDEVLKVYNQLKVIMIHFERQREEYI